MTAIVGTINRRGVAFAADSAATHIISSKHKITNHANKIYELSKYHPIGIALCGNLDFLGLPWEEIFKLYRKYISDKSKATLHEYSTDLLCFIKKEIIAKLSDRQNSDFIIFVNNFLNEVIGIAKKELSRPDNPTIMDAELFSAVMQQLDSFSKLYEPFPKCKGLEDYDYNKFEIYSNDIINNALSVLLSSPDCPQEFKVNFTKTLYTIITSDRHIYLCSTEIIIWGFGENELFPSYESYVISLTLDGYLRYTEKSKYVVSNENVACVEPFAQTDVANTVIRGIDQELKEEFYKTYQTSFNAFKARIVSKLNETNAPNEIISVFEKLDIDAYTKTFADQMDSYIQSNYIEKLVNTISYLSKEDLADMAESLVRMTYLKRRITSEEESVGGPIDVAVITKGDGFIWLKRKHYFSSDCNPHYFERSKRI